MTSDMAVVAQMREEKGTNASRRLRASGVLPAVLTDAEGASLPLSLDLHMFEQILVHHTGENLLLDLKVADGPVRKALLTEVQHNLVNGSVIHADFREVSMTETITVSIGIELIGECVGVAAGGVLEHLVREVEVECLPNDIVEVLEVDVTNMEIGDTLSVSDIKVGSALAIQTPLELTIAAVAAPRLEEEEEEEEEGAEGGDEGEPAEAGDAKQEEE